MLKKSGFTLLLLTLALVLCLAALSPDARAVETEGECGFGVTWKFDEATGTLTLSGDGGHDGSRPWEEFASSIKTIVIESGVTYIHNYAFQNCTALTSVTIADSVTHIGGFAFENCSSLETIELPDTVTTIDMFLFNYCTALKNV